MVTVLEDGFEPNQLVDLMVLVAMTELLCIGFSISTSRLEARLPDWPHPLNPVPSSPSRGCMYILNEEMPSLVNVFGGIEF